MKHFISVGLFLLFGVILAPATGKGKTKLKVQVPIRVACIGNSVTYGTGLANPQADSYPSQLQKMLGSRYEVGNFGRPSATLINKGWLPYMKQEEFKKALAFKADIAIIHLGLNDTDPRCWPNYKDDFVKDYLTLIDSVRQSNLKCRIIIARMTPLADRHHRFESGTRDWHAEIQQAIGTVARISSCQLIDFYEPLHNHMNWFPDAIHPNKEGYGILASIVYSAITGDCGGLQLPPSFTSHMVLPRNKEVCINGIANAGDEVTVSINGQEKKATAGFDGHWTVTLSPLPSGGPYSLTAKTKDKAIELEDVLAGEVWLCSGQSNMAFKLCQAATAGRDIPQSENNNIRLLNYECRWPTNDVTFSANALDSINHLKYFTEAQWTTCNSETSAQFSAVGYYFGKMLQDSLKCPIGLICNAVGGSGCEAWIDRTTVEYEFPAILRDWTHNDFNQDWVRGRAEKNMGKEHDRFQRHPYEPCYLYEASIKDLRQYPINGVIWYQGESNAHNKDAYAKLFDMLIRSWRKAWNNGSLPFYYVQLSSLDRPSWTWFRDSQRQLMTCEPNLGMAVSSDCGDSLDVHPKSKQSIGERLARWALHNEYGKSNLTPSGPLFKNVEFSGNCAWVTFDYAEGLHTSDGQPIRTFEVAEEDGLFYPAQAEIIGKQLKVSSPQVEHPHFIRYGWQPFTRANLVNNAGLPASSFRN